jgi:AraC-like DNA-binding protein
MDQEQQEHQERRGDVVVDRALRGSGLLYRKIFAAHALDAEAASSRGLGMSYHDHRPRFSPGDRPDRSGISAIMPAAAPPLLVSHPLLDSTDLDVVRAVTGRAWGKHASDVIGRDRYRLRLNRVEGARLPVTFVDCSARIEARMEGIGCQFQVMVPLSGGIDMVIDGQPLSTSPGEAVFVRPARSMRFVASPSRCLVVDLPDGVLDEWFHRHRTAAPAIASRVLTGMSGGRVVRGALRLARLHDKTAPRRDGLSAPLPPGVLLAEAALLARIGEHLFGEGPPPGDLPPSEQVVVEVLLDWLRAHRAEPVSMGDLAAHAGVSVRAVEQAFASHVGAPPMACLRAMRLDLARRLLEAAPAGSNVTAVVLEAGIYHLGRFAGEYQRRYGELPSETLLRSREWSPTAGTEGASQNGYRAGGPVS